MVTGEPEVGELGEFEWVGLSDEGASFIATNKNTVRSKWIVEGDREGAETKKGEGKRGCKISGVRGWGPRQGRSPALGLSPCLLSPLHI